MHRRRAIFAAVFLVCSCVAAGAPNRAVLEQIPAAMQEFVDRHEVAGVVAVVGRHDGILSYDAVGLRDIESGAPMTNDTLFRIASMTKPITGLAIMLLVDEGKLAIDDEVEKHLSEFLGQMLVESRTRDTIVLKRPPRDPKEKILSKSGLEKMVAAGAFMTLVTLGVFLYYLGNASLAAKAGTMAFCVIIFWQLFYAIEISVERRGLGSLNKWVLAATVFGFLLQISIVNVPALEPAFKTTALAIEDWAVAFALGATGLVAPLIFRAVRKSFSRK